MKKWKRFWKTIPFNRWNIHRYKGKYYTRLLSGNDKIARKQGRFRQLQNSFIMIFCHIRHSKAVSALAVQGVAGQLAQEFGLGAKKLQAVEAGGNAFFQ
mgnify:CR=1 FL=1